jgi:hypothetical protein
MCNFNTLKQVHTKSCKFQAPHFEFPASGEEPHHGDLAVRLAGSVPPGGFHEPRPALRAQPGAGGREPSARAGRKTSAIRSSAKKSSKRRSTSTRPSCRGRCNARTSRTHRRPRRPIIDWLDAAPLDAVPLGQLADRIVAFLHERRGDTLMLTSWRTRNRHALRESGHAPPPTRSVSSKSSKRRWRRTQSRQHNEPARKAR